MIPKIIHYCWFGRNPKPKLFNKCYKSWKKYCPDYEIIEWNEDNFDLSKCPLYVRQAYDAKKWAFVTDYVRLKVVYDCGGIYLDADVEVVKNFDDLLDNDAFFGFEDNYCVATGLGFGAKKNNEVVKLMLKDYEDIHFTMTDGTLDKTPCPIRNTDSIKHLLPQQFDVDTIVKIPNAIIYPPEYFCPLSSDCTKMNKTKNTYSIHWYTASWLSHDEMIVHEWRIFKGKCEKILGKRIGLLFARFVYLLFPEKRRILKRM